MEGPLHARASSYDAPESGRILWHNRDKLMPQWTNLGFAWLLPRRPLDSTPYRRRTPAEL